MRLHSDRRKDGGRREFAGGVVLEGEVIRVVVLADAGGGGGETRVKEGHGAMR